MPSRIQRVNHNFSAQTLSEDNKRELLSVVTAAYTHWETKVIQALAKTSIGKLRREKLNPQVRTPLLFGRVDTFFRHSPVLERVPVSPPECMFPSDCSQFKSPVTEHHVPNVGTTNQEPWDLYYIPQGYTLVLCKALHLEGLLIHGVQH